MAVVVVSTKDGKHEVLPMETLDAPVEEIIDDYEDH